MDRQDGQDRSRGDVEQAWEVTVMGSTKTDIDR
jgi:hypothetical protein